MTEGATTKPGSHRIVEEPGHGLRLVNADLRPAQSCDQLLRWYVDRGLERVTPYGWDYGRIYAMADSAAGAPVPAPAAPVPETASSSGTGTNVQEAGVDEPDIAKTDGRLLVRVLDGRSLVVYDVTGAEPVRLASLPLTGVGSPQLLLAGDRVVVVGDDTTPDPARTTSGTVVTVVDVSNPEVPTVVSRSTYDSSLVTARQQGSVIRLVVSTGLPQLNFSQPGLLRGQDTALRKNQAIVRASTIDQWLPHVTTVDADGTSSTSPLVACDQVSIPAVDAGLGTVAIVAFDATTPQTTDVTAVTTPSDTVYASSDHLYLASSPYQGWVSCCWEGTVPAPGGTLPVPMPGPEPGPIMADDGTTHLYEFDLSGTATTYAASGEVDGSIADRWSMDEYAGVLRVAVGPTSRTGNFNSIVTLDQQGSDLVEVGRVDHLGVDEQIKSMRWFDGLAVMVTFRQTDPFYAVDLSDPTAPRLLGTLQVPGFSSYLHPLGGLRMIGIGSAADPATGITTGAKAALFDVSDVTRPRELDSVTYPQGSSAQAAYDPRQFTWLPDRRTALTVIAGADNGRTGYVSVLSIDDSRVTNRMVPVEYGVEIADVRLLPLPDGRVALVTGDAVSFFALAG